MQRKKKTSDVSSSDVKEVKGVTSTPTSSKPSIPKLLDDTFKVKLHIKFAYVDGEQWFFRPHDAKRYLKKYKVIRNPYIKE